VRENAGKWESASPRDLERIDALAHAIVNRLLHAPTARMKELRDDRVHQRMALVRDLFGLAAPEDEALATVHALPAADSRAQRR
jgi:glutamyl-tRNA reductase